MRKSTTWFVYQAEPFAIGCYYYDTAIWFHIRVLNHFSRFCFFLELGVLA